MPQRNKNDYLLEKRLQTAEPDLHRRAGDCVFVLQHMLSAFLNRFPDFTDHSILRIAQEEAVIRPE